MSATPTLSVVACGNGDDGYSKLRDLTDENIVLFFDEVGKDFSYKGDFIFLNDGNIINDNNYDFGQPLSNLFLEIINEKMSQKFKMKEKNYIARVFLKEKIRVTPQEEIKYTGSISFLNLKTGKKTDVEGLNCTFEQTNNIGKKDINEKVLSDYLNYNYNYASDNEESLTWARFDKNHIKPSIIKEGTREEKIAQVQKEIGENLYYNPIYSEYEFDVKVDDVQRYETRFNSEEYEFAKVKASFDFKSSGVSKNIDSSFVLATAELYL
ncbi:hypothetical protein [Spiroplasma alleghenense]|uniref:Uncharacterized protein n=1 Tax=Spiroplasma alleghenense TaxID=216931 RepID=A0A345Z509_9MOLU|nr:hypothetical protein [Spiroplasma alleghenense]AXK51688.1 hypothetical protein SALLE_v1c10180 [Spiroplasma alleghenense]